MYDQDKAEEYVARYFHTPEVIDQRIAWFTEVIVRVLAWDIAVGEPEYDRLPVMEPSITGREDDRGQGQTPYDEIGCYGPSGVNGATVAELHCCKDEEGIVENANEELRVALARQPSRGG